MKTIRMPLRHQDPWRKSAPRMTRSGRVGHQFFAGGDFALPHRGSAIGTEVIVKFSIRENQKQTFADRHRRFAFFAVEAGSGEVFKLLHDCHSQASTKY